MKNIITRYSIYRDALNEGLTPDQMRIKMRSEKDFINIMKQRCDVLLTDSELDIDHPIHEFLLGAIYNTYDDNRFDEKSITGLHENDYAQAFSQIEEKLDKIRTKSGYLKSLEAYNKRKAKAAVKREKMRAKGFEFEDDDEEDDE